MRGEFNSDMVYVPGGCTSKLQPADVSWNKPFKDHLQQRYDEWVFSGEKTYTPQGNMRAPTMKLLLRWIKDSWDEITPGEWRSYGVVVYSFLFGIFVILHLLFLNERVSAM